MALTPRQEKFAQEYVLTGNAAEAYRVAYPKSLKWKDSAVYSQSSILAAHSEVAIRVKDLRDQSAKRNEITIDSIMAEYDEVIKQAHESKQFSPVVTAITKKAELCGLFEKHQKQGKPELNMNLADVLRELDRVKA